MRKVPQEGVKQSPTRLRLLLPPAAALFSVAAFFPKVTFLGDAFFCRDVFRLYHPLFSYVGERIAAGEVPLWLPHQALGVSIPGLAVAGLFHPVTALYALLPTVDALRLITLGAIIIGFLGTWALARRLDAPAWAAALAAIGYAFSGSVVGLVNNPSYLHGAAAYPVFLLGLQWAASSRRVAGILLASAALALALLGGDVQTAYLFGPVGLVFILLVPRRGSWVALLSLFAAVWGLGLLMSVVQLVPGYEMLSASERGPGFGLATATTWSLHPLRLPALFLGDLANFSTHLVGGDVVPSEIFGEHRLWSPTITVGATVLVGAVWALAVPRRTRLDVGLAVLAVVLLWLALGRHGGLYAVFLRLVPFWDVFRYPEKLVLHATLPTVLLAARGLKRAASAPGHAVRVGLGVLGVVGVSAVIGAAVAASVEGAWKIYATRLAWSGFFAAVVVATTVLLFAFRGGPRLLGGVLPLVTFLQLMFVNGRPAAECAAPAEFFGADSMVASEVLEQAGPMLGRFRVSSGFARVTDQAVPPEIQSLPAAERYAWWERQVMLSWHNVLFDLESPVYYGPATPEPLGTLFSEDQKGWFAEKLPLYNTRYLVTGVLELRHYGPLAVQPVARFPSLGAYLVEYVNPRPRTWLAEPLCVAGAAEAVDALGRDTVLGGRQAVLALQGKGAADPTDCNGSGGAPEQTTQFGRVIVKEYQPERVELVAHVKRPAVLVINDAWSPEWEARVDGVARRVLRANVLVRGIPLSPGVHRIEMRYRPSGLLLGAAAATGSGWLIWILLAGAVLVRHLRSRHAIRSGAP